MKIKDVINMLKIANRFKIFFKFKSISSLSDLKYMEILFKDLMFDFFNFYIDAKIKEYKNHM